MWLPLLRRNPVDAALRGYAPRRVRKELVANAKGDGDEAMLRSALWTANNWSKATGDSGAQAAGARLRKVLADL